MSDLIATDPIIQRLVSWGLARPDVRALILTSSRTSPLAHLDRLSDYDVIIVTTDIDPYLDDGWLGDFGAVLVLYRDPIRLEHGLRRFTRVTQYEDGLKIDFTLWPPEMVARVIAEAERAGRLDPDLDAGYAVLLDKDGLTMALPPPTYRAYIPAPPSEAAYLKVIELLYHEATYVAKNLWRDELLPAKYSLDEVMKQHDLRVMLEWRMEMDHGWSVKTGVFGKGLKKYLPPDIWQELDATYVGAGIEDNWASMFAAIALFRRVAMEVGAHLGYAYPEDLHQRMMTYLQWVRTLDRRA
jgi:aminoglycoside 6-adenylyltransferase